MLTLELVLLILGSALALAVVSFGLTAVHRCLGIVPLEILPLGIASSLAALSLYAPISPSTLSGLTLLPCIIGCAVLVVLLQPVYVRWRQRLGGESISLIFSFALMTCWIQIMSAATDSKSVTPHVPELLRVNQSMGLKVTDVCISLVVFILVSRISARRGNLAALQLSLGDSRLLTTFGISSSHCQRIVLGIAALLTLTGSFLYISLQQNFSIQNSYDIIVPSFAISLAQTRIRVGLTVLTSILLLAGIECLTRLSAESTIRECHQALLFGAVVLIALISRVLRVSGRTGRWKRNWCAKLGTIQEVLHG